MEEFLEVGKIINTHGVAGEVKVMPLTDDPKRFLELEWVYIEKNGVQKRYNISRVKFFKEIVIVKFEEINSMDEAESLKECFMKVDREHAVKLPEDTFFICDLIDCEVFSEDGTKLGKLCDVLQTGSNDVYVVKDEKGRELLLPALKSVVKAVDVVGRKISVSIPEGLCDDEI